jgi:hypothetical protein
MVWYQTRSRKKERKSYDQNLKKVVVSPSSDAHQSLHQWIKPKKSQLSKA